MLSVNSVLFSEKTHRTDRSAAEMDSEIIGLKPVESVRPSSSILRVMP